MTSTPICPPLSDAERSALAARWNEHPGMRHMGVRVDLSAPEVIRVYVDPVQPHHRGGLGTDAVNGAIMAGVFDLTIGLVGRFCNLDRRSGTAQLHIHFIRPVLVVRFEVLWLLFIAGRLLVFVTADLHDQRGQLCARGEGIVAVAKEAVAEAKEQIAL